MVMYYLLIIFIFIIVCLVFKPKPVEKFLENTNYKQDIFRQILLLTKECLDDMNIPFFLSSGTCLGCVREKNFMEHDYDIDIGIHEIDYTPKLIAKMAEKGLILYRIYGSIQKGMEMSFYLSGKVRAKIDIFVHVDRGDKTCWFSYSPEGEKLQYCVSKFDLVETDFLGISVNIPDPVKKYLTEHYGKDWRIPKTNGVLGDYHYASSPESLVRL